MHYNVPVPNKKPRASRPIPIRPEKKVSNYIIKEPLSYQKFLDSPSSSISLILDSEEYEYDEDEELHTCIIYFCAVISIIIPIAGLFYLFCFRKYRTTKAYKTLIITTINGFIIYLVLILMIIYLKLKIS